MQLQFVWNKSQLISTRASTFPYCNAFLHDRRVSSQEALDIKHITRADSKNRQSKLDTLLSLLVNVIMGRCGVDVGSMEGRGNKNKN